MKRVKVFFIISFWGFFAVLKGAFEDWDSSLEGLFLNRCLVASEKDLQALKFNPASASNIENLKIALWTKALYWGLGIYKENFSIGYNFKKYGKTAFLVSNLHAKEEDWDKSYNELNLALYYSNGIAEGMYIGIGLDLYHITMPRFGSTQTFGLSFGILYKFYQKWTLGVSLFNLNNPTIKGIKEEYNLPQSLNAGICFNPFKNVYSYFSIGKEKYHDIKISFAQEFSLYKDIFTIETGFSKEEYFKFGAGFILKIKGFKLGYGIEATKDLPLTHAIGIQFR